MSLSSRRPWSALLSVVAGLSVIALGSSAARAALVINFGQAGNDVVAIGSGSANLAGLSLFDAFPSAQVNIDAATGNYRGGSITEGFARYRFISIPPTGYGSFNVGFGPGTGDSNFPSASTGNYFGLTAFNSMLLVPNGYVSGTPLANRTTWTNRTLQNLGLAPLGSSFTYTWGSGPTADSLTINITTIPEPSTAAVLAITVPTLARRRRRRRPVHG